MPGRVLAKMLRNWEMLFPVMADSSAHSGVSSVFHLFLDINIIVSSQRQLHSPVVHGTEDGVLVIIRVRDDLSNLSISPACQDR